MAKLKIFKIQTTSGTRYGIGLFEGSEMLKGIGTTYYKTKSGAERALKKRRKMLKRK